MESWLSGRKQQFTKLPSLCGLQGFESLTLRKYQNLKHVFRFCCILRESKGFEKLLRQIGTEGNQSVQKVY